MLRPSDQTLTGPSALTTMTTYSGWSYEDQLADECREPLLEPSQDPSADITLSSEFKFDRQAYLWLTAAVPTEKDIGHGVTVSRVAGMGTDELSGRQRFNNKLDGEVGLGPTSFLSANGSDALLGPAEVKFHGQGADGAS